MDNSERLFGDLYLNFSRTDLFWSLISLLVSFLFILSNLKWILYDRESLSLMLCSSVFSYLLSFWSYHMCLNKFCLDTSSESFYFPLAPSLKWCTGGDSRGSRLYMAGLRNIADSLDHSTTTARLSVFFSKYISVNYLTTHFVSIGTTEVFIFKISFLGDFDNLCPKLWPNVFFISFYF